MKKTILVLLFCAILMATASCNTSDDIDSVNVDTTTAPVTTTSNLINHQNKQPSENVYQDVIHQYQELLMLKKNNANYEKIYLSSNEEGNEIQSAVYHAILRNNPEKMGYAMKDLNGDGVDELILLNEDYHIYAIFTAISGQPVVVDASFYGDVNYTGAIGSDGTIYKHGYGKGENVYGSIMKLSDDGRLSGIEFGCSDVDIDDPAVDYYKIENGVRESINYDEFKRLNDAYYETVGNATDLTKQSCGNFVRMKIE